MLLFSAQSSSVSARQPQGAAAQWRLWVASHRAVAAILAGVVATHMATVLGLWLGFFKLAKLDWPTSNGIVYVPEGSPVIQFLVGGGMHYLNGIAFAVIFAALVQPSMKFGRGRSADLVKGLAFATTLALISLTVLCPLVYGPSVGVSAGAFSSNFGWKFQVSVLVFHWFYGAHLGLIYSPAKDVADRAGVAR